MSGFIEKCPECGRKKIYYDKDKGQILCKECGLVIDDKVIDHGQEWREFGENSGADAAKRRTGSPISDLDFDPLRTEIGSKADISKLKGKDKYKMIRLRKQQYIGNSGLEKNLRFSLSEIKRFSSILKLPKAIEEEAARIYKTAAQKGLVRGRSMESVVSAVLYAACKIHEMPRKLEELSSASGIEKKEIGKIYRFVVRELKIFVLPTNPVDYISRFSSKLKLSPECQTKAIEFLEKAQKLELTSGKGPSGIAAAALYISSLIHGEKRTQREVADVAGVTEVTIRNRYKELIIKLKLEKEVKKAKNKKKSQKNK